MIEVAVSPARIPAGITDLEIRLTNAGGGACLNVIFTIRLPVGIMRLRGPDTIRVSSLLPGESMTSPLRVRADSAGRYRLTSPNFSYQDHTGQSRRKTGFTTEIIVDPEPVPAPEPQVIVDLQTAELPLGEWTTLRGRVSNVGDVDISALEITLSGHVSTEIRSQKVALERLRGGDSADMSFFARAQEAGDQVPVHFDLSYNGPRRRHSSALTRTVRVNSNLAGSVSAHEARPVVKILFFGGNPQGTPALRVGEEIREIQQTINQGRERDNISVYIAWAVRPRDITQALIDVQPEFVHFAGHGGGAEESFAAEDDAGLAHIIPVAGLVEVFKAVGQGVQCVIINACRTERLARALAAIVPYVISMRQPVDDRSSIRFSIGFYQALAAGQPVETAFAVGKAQMMMTPLGDDALAPLLLYGLEGTEWREPAERRPVAPSRQAPLREPAQESPAGDSAPRIPEGSTVSASLEGDRVECSVFAPPVVLLGSPFLVQAFAHISIRTREAVQRAKEFDAAATRRAIKTLESSIPRGTKLHFRLTMPGLRVDDPVQSMVWTGATESVQFGVSVPQQYRPGNVVGTLTVSQDWIPIGHIKFTLTVTAGPKHSLQSASAVGDAARRYEMAFISYASEDRTTVLERVQILPAVGVRTFQDVLNLEPGERWERSLYRHIDESDIVLLFWSNAAKRSKWVRKEVRYALDRKRGDEFAPPEIGPVIIEGPPVPRPWKELAYLHFNDPRIYIIDRGDSPGDEPP